MSDRDNRYWCSHCGEASGMMAHYVTIRSGDSTAGMRLCPKTITHEGSDKISGFACRLGHVCQMPPRKILRVAGPPMPVDPQVRPDRLIIIKDDDE